MTPTPNPTAEPLKSWEVNSNAWEAFAAEEHMTNGIQAAYEAGLRAHGLLSEGAPTETKWVCGKCSREQARGHDDGQIPEHHRTCPKRTEAKQPEDWSTEELDKVTLDRLQELAEERGYDKGFAAGWKSGGKTADLLAPKLRKAQAERDAALAAIERVRAEADAYAEQSDVMEPCGAVAQSLRTALDGAPEPEWGREYRRVRPDGVPIFNAVFESIPLLDDYYTAEYRTVSPWLPVERERAMSERKRCRWFHRWDDLDVFVDVFSIAYQCRKCGYCKVTNLFTERTTYGWRKDGAR